MTVPGGAPRDVVKRGKDLDGGATIAATIVCTVLLSVTCLYATATPLVHALAPNWARTPTFVLSRIRGARKRTANLRDCLVGGQSFEPPAKPPV